tara:strand:+ start:22 stop:222 length:201 start_codon:yes stop_codon:yes gene_type:complete
MANYKGLEDRLINAGSPKSVNNGSIPTTSNLAPGIIPINNTFSKGKYEDYVLDSGAAGGSASDLTD